jgi:hypothetical protein
VRKRGSTSSNEMNFIKLREHFLTAKREEMPSRTTIEDPIEKRQYMWQSTLMQANGRTRG